MQKIILYKFYLIKERAEILRIRKILKILRNPGKSQLHDENVKIKRRPGPGGSMFRKNYYTRPGAY